jgi:AmmeMemoRadiSam system protein B
MNNSRNFISGLVLPHHDLARELIINSIKKLAAIRPGVIYIAILSPNHYRPHSDTFTSTTVLKNFSIATEMVHKIKEEFPQMVMDEKLLNGEHGLYVPMTYLSQYFPKASFIPIAVSPYYTTENLISMAKILSDILPPESLFVASTDFSHNHNLTEALENDITTINAIKNFNFARLTEFDDNNIDSPAAMKTVMYVMELRNAYQWQTWQESHGSIITGDPNLVGTSYVSGVFSGSSLQRIN